MRKSVLLFVFAICAITLSLQAEIQSYTSTARRAIATQAALAALKNNPHASDEQVLAAMKQELLAQEPSLPAVPTAPVKPTKTSLEQVEALLMKELDKTIPILSDLEIMALAEKEYPLYKLGEKVTVRYLGANHPMKVTGYFRGKKGPVVEIDSTPIRIRQMAAIEDNEAEILKFDSVATKQKREEFLEQKRESISQERLAFYRNNKDRITDLLVGDLVTANEKAGYTLIKDDWIDLDSLSSYILAQVKNQLADEKNRELFKEIASAGQTSTATPKAQPAAAQNEWLLAMSGMKEAEKPQTARVTQPTAGVTGKNDDATPKTTHRKSAAKKPSTKKTAPAPEPEEVIELPEVKKVGMTEEQLRKKEQEQIIGSRLRRGIEKSQNQQIEENNERKKKVTIILILGSVAILMVLGLGFFAWRKMVEMREDEDEDEERPAQRRDSTQKDFWTAVALDSDHFKYVAYMFPTREDATEALSQLSFLSMGARGEFRSTRRNIRFGVYEQQDGAVCFVGGTALTYSLWKEAKEVLFQQPRASYFKVSSEPSITIDLPDLDDIANKKHVFIQDLGTEDIRGEHGEFNRVFKYKTKDKAVALDFLDEINVTEPGMIFHVETTEGFVCKDENGVFEIEE